MRKKLTEKHFTFIKKALDGNHRLDIIVNA